MDLLNNRQVYHKIDVVRLLMKLDITIENFKKYRYLKAYISVLEQLRDSVYENFIKSKI